MRRTMLAAFVAAGCFGEEPGPDDPTGSIGVTTVEPEETIGSDGTDSSSSSDSSSSTGGPMAMIGGYSQCAEHEDCPGFTCDTTPTVICPSGVADGMRLLNELCLGGTCVFVGDGPPTLDTGATHTLDEVCPRVDGFGSYAWPGRWPYVGDDSVCSIEAGPDGQCPVGMTPTRWVNEWGGVTYDATSCWWANLDSGISCADDGLDGEWECANGQHCETIGDHPVYSLPPVCVE